MTTTFIYLSAPRFPLVAHLVLGWHQLHDHVANLQRNVFDQRIARVGKLVEEDILDFSIVQHTKLLPREVEIVMNLLEELKQHLYHIVHYLLLK